MKLHALLAHRSQFRSTMKIDAADPDDGRAKAFADRLEEHHRRAGSTLGWEKAEAFKLVTNI